MSNQASLGDISGSSEEDNGDKKRRPEIKGKSDDWQVIDLQDIVEIKGGGTPSKSNEEYWNGEIPWASVKDLTELTNLWKTETQDYITGEGLEESSSNLIPENSVIISTRMTVGEPFINLEEMSINQDLKGLIPNTEKVNTGFLLYALWGKDNFLKSLGRGTTVSGITTRDLERLGIALPEKDEQRRIASVLYNVDQAIQKTEEIIEQTQRVKKGLMQDLFTEGYYSHEEFEDEGPLEKRPADWKIRSLNKVADIEMGSSPKSEYYNEDGEGLPFYQGNNEFGDRYPNTEVWCSDPVKTAEKDDILISVRAPVGDLNVAPEKCCIGRGLAGITAEEINRDYLFYHLKERENFLVRISAGSTYDSINSSQLKNLKLKIPDPEEQEKIAETLQDLDNKINSNKRQEEQLQRLKKGLMQDLLTGSVRTGENVRVLDEVVEVEG